MDLVTITTYNINLALKNVSQEDEDPRVLAMSYMMYKIGKIGLWLIFYFWFDFLFLVASS